METENDDRIKKVKEIWKEIKKVKEKNECRVNKNVVDWKKKHEAVKHKQRSGSPEDGYRFSKWRMKEKVGVWWRSFA